MEIDRERTQLLLRRSGELQREYDDLVRSLSSAYDSVRSINAALAENRAESRQLFQDLIALMPTTASTSIVRPSSLRSSSDGRRSQSQGQGQRSNVIASTGDASDNATAEKVWDTAEAHSRISRSRASLDNRGVIGGDVVTPDLLRNGVSGQSNDHSISGDGVATVFYSGEHPQENCNVIYFPSNVSASVCDGLGDGDDHSYTVNEASGDSSVLTAQGDGYVLQSKPDNTHLNSGVISTNHDVDLRCVKSEPGM
ncbi:hypothetical protein QAD02_024427 [Eretmocerus hayati]|uniref:Uncharacterized protein n=1 Tax=Eretmocerus hayati TaxID=131215 RepID=A0ACC2Q246_9HYME|nr:hypothetical protein QAD02_024427 [Eretmocerus hayati]